MKILHVITSLRTGGAEKLMVDLLPRFQDQGFEINLLLFDGKKTPFYKELEISGIKIIDFGETNSVYNPRNILRLRKLIHNYDIIHTHNTSPQFFAALANIGIGKKLITTEHNTYNRRRNWPGFSLIDHWMYDRYSKIICISDQARTNLEKFLGKCKADIKTIYNGVNVNKFASARPGSDLEKIAPGSKKIIMVAAFRPQKDQITLIKSMELLPPEFHLFLVGEGTCLQECQMLTKEMSHPDRVHFMGLRTDVPNLLHAADYVVMSSHFEGLSLSSVEGMAVGKPFLASDVDGLREVVKGAGILFPHQDDKAFAEEILKLDGDEDYRNRISEQCAERAQNYDISTMAENYMKVYQDLMNMKVTEVKATKSLENI